MCENKINQNIYRVGDWVYCETSPNLPYCIRKIEELIKTQNGNVEARVTCAFRRRDISLTLLTTLDKNPFYMISQFNSNSDIEEDFCSNTANLNEHQIKDEINDLQRFHLKHRELFYSKYSEQIQVSIIRGKCNVHLYTSNLDTYSYYLSNEDTFYYQLTYDPNQKKLLSDEGKIRVGSKYQADIPNLLTNHSNTAKAEVTFDREEIIWNDNECKLNDDELKKFILIAKSIGTLARAYDCSNNDTNINNDYHVNIKNQKPNLILCASNASRDITLFNSYKYLHESEYNLSNALLNFFQNGNEPILCKDEIENWSINEINLFEEGLDKFGKNFNEIRKEFLKWKSLKSIVEYYYLWKTTDRYVSKKHNKETQSRKLNQVYIPNYQKQHQAQIILKDYRIVICESCNGTQSNTWFLANISQELKTTHYQSNTQYLQSYNQSNVVYLSLNQQQQYHQPQQQFQPARLCSQCWVYWKKYGSFKFIGNKDMERPGPDRRLERINAVRAQIHKCEIEDCGKEFKLRTQLTKHSLISHAIAIRGGIPKSIFKPLKCFYLNTTPISKASRLICLNIKKNARSPFELIDFKKIKYQWLEEMRNIRDILEIHKLNIKSNKKSILKILKINDPIDNNKNIETNLILKYLNNNTKSYSPNYIRFIKPTDETIKNFLINLNTQQSRKRNHDNLQTDTASDDSCTTFKRTLLNNSKSNYNDRTNINDQLKYGFKNKSTIYNTNNKTSSITSSSSILSSNNSHKEFFLFINNNEKHKRLTILNYLNYDLKRLAKKPFTNEDILVNNKKV